MIKKILVTQRIDKIKSRNITIESIDKKLLEFCMKIGAIPISVSSTVCNKYGFNIYLNNFSFDGIILSGGNDIGSCIERDNFENQLLKFSISQKMPVFGICRGLQLINIYEKGSLLKIDGHCKTRHNISGESGILSREVNSYHNFGLRNCPEKFNILAMTDDGFIEAISHKSLPWEGWMWHPERELIFNDIDQKRLNNLFCKGQ